MLKAVIWDFNGTLLDDFELGLRTINQMLSSRNLPVLSRDDYLTVFDFPVISYYGKVGFDFATEPFSVLAEEYMAVYKPASLNCPLHNSALETLSDLQARGVRQILLSATERDFLLEQTGHFGLDCYFDEIIGLGDILGSSKLEMASDWFCRQGLAPEETLLIGDTTHDFEVASALGCRCLLLVGGHNARNRLERTGARVIDSLAGVLPFLDEK